MKKILKSCLAVMTGISVLLAATSCGKGNVYKAGSYTAESMGKNGDVKVEVTFTENKISDVKILSHAETPGISDPAIQKIPEAIVAKQSTAIDVVTGATVTSNAILAAVKDCINQAGGEAALNQTEKKVASSKTQTVKENADIVVVGGGAAGSAAALAAVKAGANVIVLEKTASPMGAGTIAGGMFAADSSLQKAAGRTVSKKWLYDEYMAASHGFMNNILVRKVIDEAGKTVDFLLDNGVRLNFVDSGVCGSYVNHGRPSTLHGYADGGTVAITTILEDVKKEGGKVMFSTPAKELLFDENGNACGVKAQAEDGTIYEISAKKVILATGGFGGNEAMLKELYGDNFTFGEVRSNTGDGINMAWAAGAAPYGTNNMHYFWETWTGEDTQALISKMGDAFFSLTDFTFFPHLRVNKFGQRFCNEKNVTDFAIHGAEIAMQPDTMEWLILDDTTLSQIAEKGYVSIEDHFGAWKNNRQWYMEFNLMTDTTEAYNKACTPTDYRPLLDKGAETAVVVKADTIAELAKKMSVKEDVLKQSIDMYNNAITTGNDTEFFANLKGLPKVEKGPFYAVKYVARNLGTLGGVRINENFEAVKNNGDVVPNIYVVGADAGGMYGRAYVDFEGGTLGFAYTSGRLAGENAAKAVK
ncbi:MAG: FAD-dependent oxidoreductase [Treponema sp.]|nr:FAD-dependent oxidoreductase [Treponema sp.]